MISVLHNLLRICRIISKEQILIYSDNIKIPLHFKIIGYLLILIFSPISLVAKSKQDFGRRLTKCLTKLGPIYIKFGQTLSTRPDLIGKDIAKYLQTLQDKLPSFDNMLAKNLIQKSFNQDINKIFADFCDTPIAAASISQVHKAQLISGEFVAVKILRPDIHRKYNRDIKLLYFLAGLACRFSKLKRLKPIAVVQKFQETMKYELDLRLEAAAASELTDNLYRDHEISIPKIYWQLTSENILTTQWLEGISIYDIETLKKAKLNLTEIAQKFAIMFFNQAFRDGFFHADLHPGNILVTFDGKIILLDFGIMGRLSSKDRLNIAESLFGFLNRDYNLVAKSHLRAGYIPKNTDLNLFAQSCRAVTEPIIDQPVNISVGKLLAHLFKITEDFGMETQPELLLLQKTIVTVEGIGRLLDPNINMWELARPWIKKWGIKNLTPEAKILRLIKHYIEGLYDKLG